MNTLSEDQGSDRADRTQFNPRGGTPVVVALYARASVKDGGQELDRQLSALRQYCRCEDLEISREYSEKGSTPDVDSRTQWPKLLEGAAHGKFDMLVVTSPDRVSRRENDIRGTLAALRHLGVAFASLSQGHISE